MRAFVPVAVCTKEKLRFSGDGVASSTPGKPHLNTKSRPVQEQDKIILSTLNSDLPSFSRCCAKSDVKSSESETEQKAIYKTNISPSGKVRGQPLKYKGSMEPTFKCLVIGDIGVGKTSFVQKYVYNRKIKDYKATLGVDFALKILQWSDNVCIKLQLWDIAGQERFASMTRVYYRDAHACIIMFDLTNKDTFLNVLKWKKDLDNKCSLPDGSGVPCILLGNKCDLSHREVGEAEIEKLCKDHAFIGHGEISVKKDRMVEESMRHLLNYIMERYAALEDSFEIHDLDNHIVLLENKKMHGPDNSRDNCSC